MRLKFVSRGRRDQDDTLHRMRARRFGQQLDIFIETNTGGAK